jgi:hypothetical protein
MLRVEPVEELQQKPVAAAFEFREECLIDLGREALVLPLKLGDQVFIQRFELRPAWFGELHCRGHTLEVISQPDRPGACRQTTTSG